MAIRQYDISLDTKVRISNVVIRGRLGDGKGSIVANVTVFNDGKRYNFTGLTPQYEAKLADGSNIIRDKSGFTNNVPADGSFTYTFPSEMFSVEGYAKASYFTFLDSVGAKQSTFDIAVEVVGTALDGKLAESYVSEIDKEISAINSELTAVNKNVTTATTAANKVISDIAANAVVKTTDTANWQKYALTGSAGTSMRLTNADLNTVFSAGFYYCSSPVTNAPTGATSGYLSVFVGNASTSSNTSYVYQEYYSYTLSTKHIRQKKQNTDIWSDWEQQLRNSDTLSYQRYKLTTDNGSIQTVDSVDLLDSSDTTVKNIYVTGAINNPTEVGAAGFYKRNPRSNGYTEVFYSAVGDNSLYRNVYNAGTGNWKGWVRFADNSDVTAIKGTNTGWLPLTLLNGVTASTTCYYRFYSTNGIYYLSLKGTLNAITTRDTVVAKLPATVVEQLDRVLTWVGHTSVNATTARINRWSIEVDGSIKFTASNYGTAGESGAWNPLDVTLTL